MAIERIGYKIKDRKELPGEERIGGPVSEKPGIKAVEMDWNKYELRPAY
jgi:hypothetical protein